ncbi:hypothetical protein [Stackebrandtia nassauensis]|uniref:Guanylate cyclase domain-containing protein n=1 Tax=Stackebrandtia nassauensis (strain DSM 44728 / CIP 108903 / NRRL B-16338 / NBRC 102104 / LLR-40K-21) TaxID=446470 RepID=D3QBC3_STANL|nr:hypothetical protein [Stackebrandtia nassauensis]ADD40940.1 hypothetical protein Snas_1230 [Stackebrandtia nassauensis DSM 44728]
MRPLDTMMRRLMFSADMQTYSAKDHVAQYEAQQQFSHALTEAATEAGLSDADWISQSSGDGRLAILPADTSETAVVGTFAHHLDNSLRAYNRHRAEAAKVRIRMAVHEGVVHVGDNGFVSQAVNTVSHLCDSRALRDALSAFPDAGLALLVSERIYHDVIAHQYQGIRRDRFREVRVPTKHGVAMNAWICVLNEDINQVEPPEPTADPEPSGPQAPPPTAVTPKDGTWNFGDIHATGATAFGPNASAHQYGAGHDR